MAADGRGHQPRVHQWKHDDNLRQRWSGHRPRDETGNATMIYDSAGRNVGRYTTTSTIHE